MGSRIEYFPRAEELIGQTGLFNLRLSEPTTTHAMTPTCTNCAQPAPIAPK
jgi:hypothetical protein